MLAVLSPLNRRNCPLKTSLVPRLPASKPLRFSVLFLLQALIWCALTVIFAATVQRWAPWRDAVAFAATNWLPWIVFAPLVFWLSWIFPFEKGRLLRSIPIHLVTCAAIAFAMLTISTYFAPWQRGGNRPQLFREMRPASVPREWRELPPLRAEGEGQKVERMPRGPRPPPPQGGEGDGKRKSPWPAYAYRGPGGPGGPPPGEDSFFFTRFWPPFSSIALRANVSAAVYLIVACFAHAFAYYRRLKERESEAAELTAGLSRAKLDALRLQLQPHFLFNTLNAISTLVHRDPNAADELIGDLSELLRLSLQTSQHEVPLSRELELLDRYLAIEQTRLGNRLQIVREIDPQALPALVPTFVLQPLAENAIRHGLEPRRAPGTLTLRADVVGGNLRLVVADDGVGLHAASGQRSERRGIGISNTEARLRTLHGEAAYLDIAEPETGGVQVQLVLPMRTTPPKEPSA